MAASNLLHVEAFCLGPLQTNAYLLSHPETKQAVIIDPGMNPQPLVKRISGLDVVAIVLTHAHFDHIGGVEEIRSLKGCPVYIHDKEASWLTTPKLNGSLRWADMTPPIETGPAEHALAAGQKLQLLGETFRVLHTPGHSPGSCSFHLHNMLFSGDVLFRQSVGRTDLPGGSERELYNSIHGQLFELDDATVVYPGHGPKTTIGFEKSNNPYV